MSGATTHKVLVRCPPGTADIVIDDLKRHGIRASEYRTFAEYRNGRWYGTTVIRAAAGKDQVLAASRLLGADSFMTDAQIDAKIAADHRPAAWSERSARPNPRKRRNPDAFQPGDVVHYVQGWDAKKHPTVTGTILQRYFRGDGDEWLVEAPSPYTGEMERTAVREEKLKHGPAPVKVLPFARANPRKRGNPAVKTLSGDAERARIWKRLHKLHADLRDAGLLEQAKDLNNRILRLEHAYPIRPAELRKHELDFRHALRSHRYWFQGGHAAGKAYPPVPAHDRRRNPDLSGALTISHEASGDVLIRHVAHNPGKRRNPAHSPDRYISVLTDPNSGARLWQVMGHGGLPETRAGDKDDAIWSFKRFDKNIKDANIPVWDGNKGTFTTLGAVQAHANPARRRSIDKSSPKRRQNPNHPEWVQQALKAGASLLEGGEHGFYSVKVGRHWITEADTPEGELTLGSGDREVCVLPESKAVDWIREHKLAGAKRTAGSLVPKRRRNPSAAHAAPTVSAAVCGKIHRLTQDNDHTGALLVLARDVLRSPTFTKKVAAIQSAQNRAGYLTEALNTKRNALSARMFAQAKRRLSAADYALLRRSF